MVATCIGENINESYLVKKYCLSRYQARRLLVSFGQNRVELERWLGSNGRTQAHRSQDIDQTTADVGFG